MRLYIQAFFTNDHTSGPPFAAMDLDTTVLKDMTRRQQLCVQERLSLLEVDLSPADHGHEGSEVAIRSWGLRIPGSDFWFHGQPKGEGACQTRAIAVDELWSALQTDAETPQEEMPEGFAWFGGALVYGPDDLDDLLEVLEDYRPELAAKERELEMALAIAEEKSASLQQASTASPARRSPKL
ncbi:hypothetical protein [Methylibium petroleiphilum]|uniref:hypothetical protein n=1 Tax=Methylibium petroleiphilum TaxID=105560 RepID=UPI00003CD632|nr:hypothetical protein [Methylibium petroleiphilum]